MRTSSRAIGISRVWHRTVRTVTARCSPRERALGSLVQPRLTEAQQEHRRHDEERECGEVGDSRRRRRGEGAAGQRTERERHALGHPHPTDDGLEAVARSGLLEDRVVDDGVERAGLHREVDAEEHRGDDVHPDVAAQSADEDAPEGAGVADHQHAAAAPPVGEHSGHDLEQRDEGGVGGGHHADRLWREADLGEEQLLDRHPQGDAPEEEGGDAAVRGVVVILLK